MLGSAVSYGPLEGIKEEPEKEEGLEEEEEVEVSGKERKGAPSSSSHRKAAHFRFRFGRLTEGEHVAAGWPSWLSAAAGEAIDGWLPLRSDSFKRLEKVVIFFLRDLNKI